MSFVPPTHIEVEELVSFDPRHVTRSPPIITTVIAIMAKLLKPILLCSKFNWLGIRFKLMNCSTLFEEMFLKTGYFDYDKVAPDIFIKNENKRL